jgi:tRNA pseudouridine38-40 synthase
MSSPPVLLLLALAYRGGRFFGNQLQNHQTQGQVRTVQAVLLQALDHLQMGPSNGKFAGRTDAGTHARLQYFQCWVNYPRYEGQALARRLNALLPEDVTVWDATLQANPFHGFDVRNSVEWRWYRYQVRFAAQPDCWLPEDMVVYPHPVNADALGRCAQAVVGKHNFHAFQCPDTPVKARECHIYAAAWTRITPTEACFDIVGQRFLYKMVRNLVAEQLAVASGQWSEADFLQALTQGSPRKTGQLTARAKGLTLMSVYYPLSFQYFREHTVVLQLEHMLKALELINEDLFCQTARS